MDQEQTKKVQAAVSQELASQRRIITRLEIENDELKLKIKKDAAELQKANDLMQVHYDSTTPMDEYHRGMYNGMECIFACLEHREPEYKNEELNEAR